MMRKLRKFYRKEMVLDFRVIPIEVNARRNLLQYTCVLTDVTDVTDVCMGHL